MANNKVSIDLDIEELLGLTEPKEHTLEYDIKYIAENGLSGYRQLLDKEQQRKEEFLSLFKMYYDDIVNIIDKDPKQRIAVNCYGCRTWGKDLSHHYHIQSKK